MICVASWVSVFVDATVTLSARVIRGERAPCRTSEHAYHAGRVLEPVIPRNQMLVWIQCVLAIAVGKFVSALSALAYAITALALGPLVVLALICRRRTSPKLQKTKTVQARTAFQWVDGCGPRMALVSRAECILSGECGNQDRHSLILQSRNRLDSFPQSYINPIKLLSKNSYVSVR